MVDAADFDAVWEFLQAQPDLADTAMNHGITFLMLMTMSGRMDRVEFVLDRGADIDHRDDYGRTAVTWACSHDGYETLDLLLNRGADPSVCDNIGRTPLMTAASRPHGEILVTVLLTHERIEIDAVDHRGLNALAIACRCGYPALETMLLEAGADPSMLLLPDFLEYAIENDVGMRHLQDWYRTYTMVKARHLREAALDIKYRPLPVQRVITRRRILQVRLDAATTCLKRRVQTGGHLPKVELRVLQGEGEDGTSKRRRGRNKRLRSGGGGCHGDDSGKRVLGSMVVKYAIGEMSRELFVEMMGWTHIRGFVWRHLAQDE